MNLKRYNSIPDKLLTCKSTELCAFLDGPSLFFIKGKREQPLFVTVLQHGNEPTGFEAVQKILQHYEGALLPRSMWLFIANVEAANEGARVLAHQNDYNRSWPGTVDTQTPEAQLMQEVVATVTAEPLFLSIDLHNNTGCNPHYGCVNSLDTEFLHLAALFSRTTVYFRHPVGVQSLAMAQYCPAVTLECGQAGENAALEHAVEYLEACLHLHHLPDCSVSPGDINLLHTVAVAKIKSDISFSYKDRAADLVLRADLDHFNFGVIAAGASLATLKGRCAAARTLPLVVANDDGKDIASDLFEIRGDQLVAKQDLIPSMATLDTNIIRQDCLFYVMEQMKVPAA